MFSKRWRLFRLMGIPIYLDATWLIILVLLTFSLATQFRELMQRFYPSEPSLAPVDYWILGIVGALAFFTCIVLHELGHATVARALGMRIRGITLFLFGGVAELGDEPRSARDEFLMAIAGPAVSVVLAVVFSILCWLGYRLAWSPPVVVLLGYLGAVNAMVLLFNIIPAFPLDGGRVLRSILWGASGNLRRATRWAARGGELFSWVLVAWGLWEILAWGRILDGLWLGLIAWFLNSAARSSYQQLIIRQALEGEPVRHFMNPEPIVVPPNLDLQHWVEDYVYRFHRKGFPVASNGHLEGFINTQALANVPRGEWDRHTVGELMRHDLGEITISPDADAMQALSKMQRTGSSRLLVVDNGRLVGIISLKDLLRFLHLKIELGEGDHNGGDTVPSGGFVAGESHRPESPASPGARL